MKKEFFVKISFLAGVFKALSTFLQSQIKDQGLPVSYLFSVGGLVFAISFRILDSLIHKIMTGSFYDIRKSNFWSNSKVKWINIIGLILRVGLIKALQILHDYAFKYAETALLLNPGIVMVLISTYCVFTSIIFLVVFNERLQTKFLIGILLVMVSVCL